MFVTVSTSNFPGRILIHDEKKMITTAVQDVKAAKYLGHESTRPASSLQLVTSNSTLMSNCRRQITREGCQKKLDIDVEFEKAVEAASSPKG